MLTAPTEFKMVARINPVKRLKNSWVQCFGPLKTSIGSGFLQPTVRTVLLWDPALPNLIL